MEQQKHMTEEKKRRIVEVERHRSTKAKKQGKHRSRKTKKNRENTNQRNKKTKTEKLKNRKTEKQEKQRSRKNRNAEKQIIRETRKHKTKNPKKIQNLPWKKNKVNNPPYGFGKKQWLVVPQRRSIKDVAFFLSKQYPTISNNYLIEDLGHSWGTPLFFIFRCCFEIRVE